MDMGEYELALESYNKALDISPNNTNYLHGKAVALKYLGKLNEAKSILEYILKIEPDAKQSKITLGMMLLTNKEFAKGMECGITLENFQDIKENDIIEIYELKEIKR